MMLPGCYSATWIQAPAACCLQLLVGGIAAIGVAAKFYWRRILRFLRIRKDEPTESRSRG